MKDMIFNLEKLIWGLPLIILLLMTHVYFTIKLKFPQKHTGKGLWYMLQMNQKNAKEGVSSFKALMAVLAGTLGTGNIIGVATAITLGGIGSIFWIFVTGVVAIATKYAETYLILKYRKKGKNGYIGGTMYVLRDRLKLPVLGVIFSIFVVIASFGIGSMIQSNAIAESLLDFVNASPYLIGVVVTLVCSYVVLGNEKRVANVSSILVPISVCLYVYLCVFLCITYHQQLGESVLLIIKQAFQGRSVVGGIVGVSVIKALSVGLSKGLFSNEAGMGSTPMFDVTVREQNIKKQSIISSTSVFIDTVVLCTLTGILFVATGMYRITNNPVELARLAFSTVPMGNILFVLVIVIFAVATIPCWGFYGSVAMRYLFPKKQKAVKVYQYCYIISIYIGAISTVEMVWAISSIANALMILPNLVMLYTLRKEVLI